MTIEALISFFRLAARETGMVDYQIMLNKAADALERHRAAGLDALAGNAALSDHYIVRVPSGHSQTASDHDAGASKWETSSVPGGVES